MKIRIILSILALTAFFSAAVGGAFFYYTVQETALHEAERDVWAVTKAMQLRVVGFLSENLKSVKTLAGLAPINLALQHPDPAHLADANSLLDHFQTSLEVSVCYLLDRRGKTIATSNRASADSFLGHNYGFRPYFKKALAGQAAVYMALGVTSAKRGVYYSYPVYTPDHHIAGVVVIKSSIHAIEQDFAQEKKGALLLVDPQSVIFASNKPDWLYQTLWQQDEDQIVRVVKTRQFGSQALKWLGMKKTDPFRAVSQSGRKYLLSSRPVPNYPGWKVVYLESLAQINQRNVGPLGRFWGRVLIIAFSLLGLAVVIMYRKASRDLTMRYLAEGALRNSEQLYRAIVEDQTQMIARFEPDMTLTFVNSGYCNYFKRHSADLVGCKFTDFIPADEKEAALAHLTTFSSETPVKTVVHRVKLPNGRLRWLERTDRAFLDDTGRPVEFQSVGRDITQIRIAQEILQQTKLRLENRVKQRTADLSRINRKLRRAIEVRKHTEENLRQSQQRYEMAVSSGRVGVWGWNLITNEIYRDPILRDMLGYETNEIGNDMQSWLKLIHANDADRVKSRARDYLKGKSPDYEVEYRMRHKDGGMRWFLTRGIAERDKHGVPHRLIGTDTDITALKQTEEALRESETRFRALTESTASAIFIIQGDYFRYVNPAAEAMLGYSRKDIKSLRYWDPIHPDMRAMVLRRGRRRQEGINEPEHYELKTVTRANEIRWLDYTATRIFYRGKPAILGTAIDITDRKQSEDLIRTSLRDKEALLREIHHRVKNNLQIISSLLDMSGNKIDNQPVVDLLADARGKIHTMALIHMQLYQSDHFDRIHVEEHVRKLTAYLSRVYNPDGGRIAYRVHPSRVHLSITQAIPCALALNEIISNAFKHAFNGAKQGLVDITIDKPSQGRIRIEVADNGCGFPRAINLEEADTLGLKLVRNLIRKQLAGSVKIDSNPGTRVVLEFKELENEQAET